jgi:hypothetical protein
MVASAVFITDLSGKSIISRNYRGDIPLTQAIERFAKYLTEVEDEDKRPVFHTDSNGEISETVTHVGMAGPGGQTYVYIQVICKLVKSHVIATSRNPTQAKLSIHPFHYFFFVPD